MPTRGYIAGTCGYIKKNYSTHLRGNLHLHKSSVTTWFQCFVLEFLSLSFGKSHSPRTGTTASPKENNHQNVKSPANLEPCACPWLPVPFATMLSHLPETVQRNEATHQSTGHPNSSAETTQLKLRKKTENVCIFFLASKLIIPNCNL